MRHNQRIVTQLPLKSLWSDESDVFAEKIRHLSKKDIREILQDGPIQFVVANIGAKLLWISTDECYKLWKSKIKNSILDNCNDSMNNELTYIASEWVIERKSIVVLLEAQH